MRTGRVDEGVRSWLLRHATVLAYPSLDEGFGFPLLDAMQAGTPVVASTAGSIPEIAGDAALLRDPLDVDGLAEALAIALSDTIVRERLVAAGNARWQQFDWQVCAEGIADLYGLAVRGATDELR
jgi:glycosyltransferase involved in cell wall biosynthesis